MIQILLAVKMLLKNFGVEEMQLADEVFRSKYARHFDQAENRTHNSSKRLWQLLW